jgi:hypothetical protein
MGLFQFLRTRGIDMDFFTFAVVFKILFSLIVICIAGMGLMLIWSL